MMVTFVSQCEKKEHKKTRWWHFPTECETIQASYLSVSEMEKQELTQAECGLKETHRDIMQNFDPNVVMLRKKRKIVIAPGVFDAVLGENHE